jgi:hypothetical protein
MPQCLSEVGIEMLSSESMCLDAELAPLETATAISLKVATSGIDNVAQQIDTMPLSQQAVETSNLVSLDWNE